MVVSSLSHCLTGSSDTLRAIAERFLGESDKWRLLRSLNSAHPDVRVAGPDTPLPYRCPLALPGEPLPWERHDTARLWMLAESMLMAAWGRVPQSREVEPFWLMLRKGLDPPAQRQANMAQRRPAGELGLTSTPDREPPEPDTTAADPAPITPPAGLDGGAWLTDPAPPTAPAPPIAPALDAPLEPPAGFAPPEGVFTTTPQPFETPPTGPAPPIAPALDAPLEPPAGFAPPEGVFTTTPQPFETPPTGPAPPALDAPLEPPAGFAPPEGVFTTTPQPFETPPTGPAPPALDAPLEPPAGFAPPEGFVPPPGVFTTTPQPFETPPAEAPSAVQGGPITPTPDFGPLEAPPEERPETEAPRIPQFMPSVTGAPSAIPAQRTAGSAISDAVALWRVLGRGRSRRSSDSAGAAVSEQRAAWEQLQAARADAIRLVEDAMRYLWAVTVGRSLPAPHVQAVRVGSYGLEVLLSTPTLAPEGWQSAAEGYVMEMETGIALPSDTSQGPTLCPALVVVGETAEGPLLLNLQEIRCLALSGPSEQAVRLLSAIAAGLAASPAASDVRVVSVGVTPDSAICDPDRITGLSFDSPALEQLVSATGGAGGKHSLLLLGPGNDLLIQRAGQAATSREARLCMVGATSSPTGRWPWRIDLDASATAIVQPLSSTIRADQAPGRSQRLTS